MVTRTRAPAPTRPFQDRLGKRSSLVRIGTRGDLVDQHKRPRTRRADDLREPSHMRRERGQAQRNRLLVTDVGENPIKDGQPGASGGNPQPALGQRGEHPQGLQRNGLATRVWPADDQGPDPPQIEVDGDDAPGVEQRMPCTRELRLVAVVDRTTVPVVGQARRCKREIVFGEGRDHRGQFPGHLADPLRHLGDDPFDLGGLHRLQLAKAVVRLDGSSGSTNSVLPDAEVSWTMPGTAERELALTASTGRPPRSVVKVSCR